MSSLIRNGGYLSVTERVGTKSNYRPLLTNLPVTSILHYSTLSPGCRQTLTPTHVQHAFTCIRTEHKVMIKCASIRYGVTGLNCGKLKCVCLHTVFIKNIFIVLLAGVCCLDLD